MSSRAFHAVYDWMTGHQSDPSIAEFGIYSARIIREYNKLGEVARSFNFLIEYLGFRVTAIDVDCSVWLWTRSSPTAHGL